jgi:hypothetical protein
MYCPICERSELNKPQLCESCFTHKHLQQITICSICEYKICNQCFIDDKHECTDILEINNRTNELKDAMDIYIAFFRYKVKENTFRLLGDLETSIGTLVITKEYNSIIFIWDIMDNEILFKHVTDQIHMKRYRICNFKRGIKIYNTKYKHTMKHICEFVVKMKNYRLCTACGKDIVICNSSNYCRKCHVLKRLFSIWKGDNLYDPIYKNPDKHHSFDEMELLCQWCTG